MIKKNASCLCILPITAKIGNHITHTHHTAFQRTRYQCPNSLVTLRFANMHAAIQLIKTISVAGTVLP